MHRRAFWKTVTVDKSDLLDRLLTLLRERRVRFCVIGGQGVNAYAEPVVSLDLDIVVAVEDLDALTATLEGLFHVGEIRTQPEHLCRWKRSAGADPARPALQCLRGSGAPARHPR